MPLYITIIKHKSITLIHSHTALSQSFKFFNVHAAVEISEHSCVLLETELLPKTSSSLVAWVICEKTTLLVNWSCWDTSLCLIVSGISTNGRLSPLSR